VFGLEWNAALQKLDGKGLAIDGLEITAAKTTVDLHGGADDLKRQPIVIELSDVHKLTGRTTCAHRESQRSHVIVDVAMAAAVVSAARRACRGGIFCRPS
jgi:hypothetical protein